MKVQDLKEFLDNLDNQELLYLYREKVGLRCKRDLYFLTKYVLNFKDLNKSFHKPLCYNVQSVNPYVDAVLNKRIMSVHPHIRNRLWLIFRGSFKTTILSLSHTIQLILRNTDIRILLGSNKLDNSKEMLSVIKNVFMYNELFRLLFPQYCPKASEEGKVEWGTSTIITVPNRTDLTLKEGTIECAGVDTGLTSRHYDYMKKDDLVTQKSVTTEDQIKASIDWDRLSLSLFESPERGFTDWIGTRYDHRDLYGHLLKRDPSKMFLFFQTDTDKQGNSVFPERFSKQGLEQIRQDQGSVIYASQYKLDPISPEDQLFKDEWVNRCTYLELPREYAAVINVDPAAKRRKSSKFTAMLVHLIDRKGVWYLADGVYDKLDPGQRVEALFKLALKWYKFLRLVTYETIGFQETDQVFIERTMKDRKKPFHIRPITSQTASKIDRISGLSPLYEHQFIRLPVRLPYFSKYENREIDIIGSLKFALARFPQLEYFDLLDAQAQLLGLKNIRPFKRGVVKRKIEPGCFLWYREKLKKYNKNPLRVHYSIEEVWDKIKVRNG